MSWFSFSSISQEIKKIHWPKQKEVIKNTGIVVLFVGFFMLYFLGLEFLLSAGLKMIGIGG